MFTITLGIIVQIWSYIMKCYARIYFVVSSYSGESNNDWVSGSVNFIMKCDNFVHCQFASMFCTGEE